MSPETNSGILSLEGEVLAIVPMRDSLFLTEALIPSFVIGDHDFLKILFTIGVVLGARFFFIPLRGLPPACFGRPGTS